jgi:hypothetical protein
MEPFEPIPGRPPRKVVIDRQRKLFASLDIEELLLELVSNINSNDGLLILRSSNSHLNFGEFKSCFYFLGNRLQKPN